MSRPAEELLLLEDALWVLRAPVGLPAYDFSFENFLRCRHPFEPPAGIETVARVGAVFDYEAFFQGWASRGVRLVHTPEEYLRASELRGWYPLIEHLTPRSLWGDLPPGADAVGETLGWPVFVKGSRQTSRHRKSLSLASGPDEYAHILAEYARDPILRWQQVVCREYVPLRPVEATGLDRLPSSFEFRTFWWRGELAGFGRYWWEGKAYEATARERDEALAIAQQAARRVNVPFLVVDVAQAADGRWLVIECNDGQESGYAGVSPVGLWQSVVACERRRA